MVKVDKNLATKLQNLNNLDLASMILNIAAIVVMIIGFIFLVIKAAMSPTGSVHYEAHVYGFPAIILMLLFMLIVSGVMALRITIAVKHNSQVMKNFYQKAGVGQTPGVIAIIGIFVFPTIMSIIVYATTRKALIHPEEYLN